MLPKDFENYELRLLKLREESRESFDMAEKYFQERYNSYLQDIFPRDILGAKKKITGLFTLHYGEQLAGKKIPNSRDIFNRVVSGVVSSLALSTERREALKHAILKLESLSSAKEQYFENLDSISRDPFFALVEDFSLDGMISQEEFLLLSQSFEKRGDFIAAIGDLPEGTRDLFLQHIQLSLDSKYSEKRKGFESEYSSELAVLAKKGANIAPVIAFVSRFYYKTPGKLRNYEHPKRRLRRSFKLALLKLLRLKLGNIDAEKILERFESGEGFEDYFYLIYQLLEVVDENPSSQEIYSTLKLEDEVQSDVLSAEETKQKILAGESLVTRIANLFGKADAKKDSENQSELLHALLDDTTDIVGEEIHFRREDQSGIYAEASEQSVEDEDDELENASPEVAYEILKHRFHELEVRKSEAYKSGNYDEIDEINKLLLDISIKLDKLIAVLGIEL